MSHDFYSGIYNPDVLSCLANLSNDEVFTPPEVANSMLDMLPQELFSNPNTKFLDPACKSRCLSAGDRQAAADRIGADPSRSAAAY